MVKERELSYEERLTVKILRETGLSFPKIGIIVGCHHSTAFVAKLQRTGRPKKYDERGERAMCREAKRLRFDTFPELFQYAFPTEKHPNFLLEKILCKYVIKSRIRKRKPFLSVKNRKY